MLLLVGSLLAYGDTIGERDAADIAQRMMATFGTQSGTVGKKSAPRQAVKPRLAYAAKKVGQETAALYVYNNGDDGGFVIVAGDDRAFSLCWDTATTARSTTTKLRTTCVRCSRCMRIR